MLNVVNRCNVRQTDVNVALKRFADDIRTIRRQTVSNVRKSYPQVIHRCRKVIHKLSTSYPQAEANVCSAGRGRGANVCSSRRAPKRFLQIFKTRVIISYRIALSIVFQSYPSYSKAIHRVPKLSLVFQSYPTFSNVSPTSSKAILPQLNVLLRSPTSSKVSQ